MGDYRSDVFPSHPDALYCVARMKILLSRNSSAGEELWSQHSETSELAIR